MAVLTPAPPAPPKARRSVPAGPGPSHTRAPSRTRRMRRAVMTKITIVDGRPRFREVVGAALAAEGFGVEWPDDVESWLAQPGRMAIIDLTDPQGVALLQQLRRSGSAAPVLGLVDGQTAQEYAEALHIGATNVVSMRAHPDIIIDAVHGALAGRVILPPGVVKALTQSTAAQARPQLSESERRVLQLMAEGHSMAKIARELHISERTVYREAQRIQSLLDVSSRAEALIRAAQWGYVDPPNRQSGERFRRCLSTD